MPRRYGQFMRLLYLVSTAGNRLYDGKHEIQARYQTCGQHSFIYDLIAAASRRGIIVDLVVDGLDAFPLAAPLASFCNVHDLAQASSLDAPDFALVDEIPPHLLDVLPSYVPAFCIVHNAAAHYPHALQTRCFRFVCMTETAVRHQTRSIPREKLVLIHQGVDTERFRLRPRKSSPSDCPRVLVYSRMDGEKESAMVAVIERLLATDVRLTVVGAGEAFWRISDRFGTQMTLINHIPCHSIHHFMPEFDVVVSSGRGAMEALASGVPALCAGFEYAGLVTRENIRRLLETNLTGYGFGIDLSAISEDVRRTRLVSPLACRHLAEEHCSVDRFLDQLLYTFSIAGRESVSRGHARAE